MRELSTKRRGKRTKTRQMGMDRLTMIQKKVFDEDLIWRTVKCSKISSSGGEGGGA